MERRHILNLEELLCGPFTRLKNVTRFSNLPRLQDESVAEHSYYTALYSYMIAFSIKKRYNYLDLEAIMARSLVHDIEESCSGDFIRSFKHSSPTVRNAIDMASRSFAFGIFDRLEPLTKQLRRLWSDAKCGTLEGAIVKFADFLSVLSYMLTEVRLGNMVLARESAGSMRDYLDSFDDKRFDPIREYVNQAEQLLEEITHASKKEYVRRDRVLRGTGQDG